MKKKLAFLLLLLQFACTKSHPDITTIKYEFTTDVPANYQLSYAVSNNATTALIFNGTSWSQSLGVSNNPRSETFSVARLTAYPPKSWAGTSNSAHITLSISIDGNEKVNVDTVLTHMDSAGVTALYTF